MDEVERIHRLSWTELLPIPTLKFADTDGLKIGGTTGALDIDGRLILMVDFESVADAILMQDKLKIRSVDNPLGVDRIISGEALDQPNVGEVALQSA